MMSCSVLKEIFPTPFCRQNISICSCHGSRCNFFVVLEQWFDSSHISECSWIKDPFFRSSSIHDTVNLMHCCICTFRLVWIFLVALLVGQSSFWVSCEDVWSSTFQVDDWFFHNEGRADVRMLRIRIPLLTPRQFHVHRSPFWIQSH